MDNSHGIGHISRKQNVAALVIVTGGVLLNLALNTIVTALELPLYLDTVGSVAAAVIGGYLPGVLVGFATNIIKRLYDVSSLHYGILNVLIAFFAAVLARKGWFRKIGGIIGAIAVFVLIGGGIGALIPWYIDGISFDSETLSATLYATGSFSPAAAHMIGSLLMEIPDKALTVLLVVAMLRLMPEKVYRFFNFESWAQLPYYNEESAKKEKAVQRRSLKGKIILVSGLSLVVVSTVIVVISVNVYQQTITREYTRIAQGTAEISAGLLDGDQIDEWLDSGGSGEEYEKAKRQLARVRSSSVDIEYLYVYKIAQDGCYVVFDLETENTPADRVGAVLPLDKGFSDQYYDLLAGKRVTPVITTDDYGYLLTAYEPVYSSSGKCVCYVGADIDMSRIVRLRRSFLIEVSSSFLAFLILLAVFGAWVIEFRITLPINTITRAAEIYSTVGDDQKEQDKNVRQMRELGISTGDEVERLYKAVCRMAASQSEQLRSIRRLSDSTAKMQDGLIITMANMVENRDSDTGAHILKTSAYVRIVVEGLKKKGYYAGKVTPKFISDVVRSAPLHDVGKINIPDEVLNKPGKLTAEEFEIMKTHTTAGKQIIEHAISTIEGDNYLKEARNMAAYHHERWDGKGYPEGLHGEVIPLSARIMAVADVFDALSSPRVYKPAFPFEKAIAIIEEGKGTQFDPKCVEVFMDSLDEVKAVLKKYNQDV